MSGRFFAVFVLLSAALHAAVLFMPRSGFSDAETIPVRLEKEDRKNVDMILPEIKILGDVSEIKKEEKTDKKTQGMSNPEKHRASGEDEKQMLIYNDMVKQRIQNARKYPYTARKHGVEGEVTAEFEIKRSGDIGQVKLVSSSGADILDNEALATVKRAAPYPEIPAVHKENILKKRITLIFKLN
ncbi:MAG: energy transducer TonB [Candidatus Goldiibacteriota bacterium]